MVGQSGEGGGGGQEQAEQLQPGTQQPGAATEHPLLDVHLGGGEGASMLDRHNCDPDRHSCQTDLCPWQTQAQL